MPVSTQPIQTSAAAPPDIDPLERFLTDQGNTATRRAYAADLRDFFGGDPTVQQVTEFLALPAPLLAERLTDYKARLLARSQSEATVNRHLSAVRSLIRFAHKLGLSSCDGRGLVDGAKVQRSPRSDPVGPAVLKRLVAAPSTATLRGLRDSAILRLLSDNALRRAELCALDVEDFSLSRRQLLLPGRRRGAAKEPVPLTRTAAEAIAAYLVVAGHAANPGSPLFRNVDHRPGVAGERLTVDGLYYVVREYGRAVGVGGLTPQRLRQSAVMAALEGDGGSLRRVLRLSEYSYGLSSPVSRDHPAEGEQRPASSGRRDAAAAGAVSAQAGSTRQEEGPTPHSRSVYYVKRRGDRLQRVLRLQK